MTAVRFAVVGLKHFHILTFVNGMRALSGAKFVGFYDDDPELRQKYSEEFGAPAFASVAELVAAAEPEFVGVAVENGKKGAVICELVRLGCHVLVDKPLVTSFAELDDVEAAHVKTGKQIGLMLMERYNGPTRAVRELLLDGKLGRVVNFTGLAPHKLKPAGRPAWMFDPDQYGGVLNDLCIHNIDLCRWMWDTEPVAVTAAEGNLRFTEFNGFTDHAEVFLEFADSSTAMLRADWLTPEGFPAHGDGRQFFECTEGTIEILAAPDIHRLGEGTINYDAWDAQRTQLAPAPPEKTAFADFVALCRGAATAEIFPADGFRSTRVTLDAREAARTGQKIDLREKL
jgi:predicted dehydrogenase